MTRIRLMDNQYPSDFADYIYPTRMCTRTKFKLSIQFWKFFFYILRFRARSLCRKQWLKVLFADLLREKNIVTAEKISWKIRIIKQANMPLDSIGLDQWITRLDRCVTTLPLYVLSLSTLFYPSLSTKQYNPCFFEKSKRLSFN
jgi:hypothetical protein